MENIAELRAAAESFMRQHCHDKDDWEFFGVEQLSDDPWMAEFYLAYRRNDYVRCYVGFRDDYPIYVLQRIE